MIDVNFPSSTYNQTTPMAVLRAFALDCRVNANAPIITKTR